MAALAPAATGGSRAGEPVSISIDSPQNGTTVGTELNISGTAAGPAGETLSVSVSIDGGAPHLASGNASWVLRWSPNASGEHTIVATATAGNQTATAQVTVVFTPQSPNAKIGGHGPEPTEVLLQPGDNATFWVNISGPVAGTIVRWFQNGTELPGEAGRLTLNMSFNSAGNTTVEARLFQDGSFTDSVAWNVSVSQPQRPPKIAAFRPAGRNVSVAIQETVAFNITVSDPDGDSLNITWLVDGMPQTSGIGVVSFETSFNDSGDHCVTASVFDGTSSVNITWNLTVAPDYVLGPLDVVPCMAFIVLGLFLGIWYGTRSRKSQARGL